MLWMRSAAVNWVRGVDGVSMIGLVRVVGGVSVVGGVNVVDGASRGR